MSVSRQTASSVFFTSDQHFGHAAVLQYCNRPFKDTEEMKEALIKRWNSVVRDQDLVYVLGDFSMYLKKEELRSILSQLKGRKILIMGNHDSFKPSEWINMGFVAAMDSGEIRIGGERVILSHFPYKREWWHTAWWDLLHWLSPKRFFKPRKFVRQLADKGLWILHGHSHTKRKLYVPGKKMIHIGVDAWDFTPVPIQKIASIIAQVKDGSYKE